MASNPLVCCVMLTKDRHALAKRALRCFEQQTEAHRLLIVDSGDQPFYADHYREVMSRVRAVRYMPGRIKMSVGSLRNIANAAAVEYCNPDILMHWDDDDWSAPERLAQQVALLQSSGKDAVGYREILFWKRDRAVPWDTVTCTCGYKYPRSGAPCPQCHQYQIGEAWLYSHVRQDYCLGTSLCYWRRVWEAKPFEDRNTGEDREWIRGLNTLGVGSRPLYITVRRNDGIPDPECRPLMVAEIHGGNISSRVQPESDNWKRVSQWDSRLREIMKL